MEMKLLNVETMLLVLVTYNTCCYCRTQSQPQRRHAASSMGHELEILHITDTDTGQQNPTSNLGNELKIIHVKDTENEEISLTNNLVTDPSVNRPLDYYQESPFSLNRMSKAQRRCCKRGSRAARKAMNCNPGYRKDSPKLQILNDFKTGFKLAVQMHPRDKGFMKKVKRCFLKQDTAQYFTRCCKEFGVIRSKRNN